MDAARFLPRILGPYDLTGVSYSAAGARLSYVFAMRGPCVVFDTACSSSLIAMHVARRCMQHRECSDALCIGANAILHSGTHVGPAFTGMTSARGQCHTFDSRGDGYLRGEACGAILLGVEVSALSSGACLGSSARHNGQSASFTALNGLSQQLLLRAALRDGTMDLATVLEAHGTGTALGDPIEVSAISAIVSSGGTCCVFSIKGNVGHTESTAGVAGVLELTKILRGNEGVQNA